VVTSGSIKNNTIRSVDVRNGGLLGKDFRKNGVGGGAIKESTLGTVPGAFVAHGSARFAVVNAGGQGVRGRGTTSVARTAEGRYQVIFDADVRGCGYYATIGGPTAAAPPASGEITVSSLASNVNGVDIRTNDGDDPNPGAAVNRPFHLVVLC
jgi:hypothetical protein